MRAVESEKAVSASGPDAKDSPQVAVGLAGETSKGEAAGSPPPVATPSPVRAKKAGRSQGAILGEKAIELLIRLCGISAIVFVFGIFFFVFREGMPYLPHLDFKEFFGSTKWYPSSDPAKYGVGALLIGTLSVSILSMVIAVPFGLGAAIFVSEFCTRKTKETLKIVIELLAAVPSVVADHAGR